MIKSPLEQVDELDNVLEQLHKIDGRMWVGQFLPAHKDLKKLIAFLDQTKAAIIQEQKEQKEQKEGKVGKIANP